MTKRSRPAESKRQNHRPTNSSDAPHPLPDLAHHRLKCRVCSHPNRREIEQDFLRWRSPEKIAQDYDIADHSYIYRHVHATGLFARRRLSVRAALERILERADEPEPSDFDVVRAGGAYARLDDLGRWQEPNPQNVVIFLGDPADLSKLPDLSNLPNSQISKLHQQVARIQSPTRKIKK
jgi:hypothetical protein